MLKKVMINSKKVPVPVPVQTLDEALRWIETTLVPPGHTITRVTLDDQLVDDEGAMAERCLGPDSKLEVQIDSPVDLTIQTLDAMRNLAAVILSGIKVLAVDCWQSKPTVRPAELEATAGDLELILDLIDHVTGLIGPMDLDAAAIQGNAAMLKRASVSLAMAKSNSDWKACARLLLNRVEPFLKELVVEAESLQIRIMTQTGLALAGEGRR